MANPAPKNALIQQKRDVRDLINSDHFKGEISKVLPRHLTPERMTRVALTAFLKTPALLSCTPESLTNALLICSQAGLEPDGRLAHLIPYGNTVQVIFDYKGLVSLALRNGVELIYGDKVCEEDFFDASVENGDKKLTHRPNFKKARGEAYAYYAVARRAEVTDWEVMSKEEIDAIRKRSKCPNNGPWVTDYDEMAKKTVLRRMSKRWDLIPEVRDIINADDDTPVEVRAPMMKPVFGETSDPAPAPDTAGPTPPAENSSGEPPKEPTEQNFVKAVRSLCKMSNIGEGRLLESLAVMGSTDGSVATLEELAMYQGGGVLRMVHDQWKELSAKIKEEKGGAS